MSYNKNKPKKTKKVRVNKTYILANVKHADPMYLEMMLTHKEYAFIINKFLYETKAISAKSFLYSDNMFTIKMVDLQDDGSIILKPEVQEVYNRFMLSMELMKAGEHLSSFLIGVDAQFYSAFFSSISEEQDSEKKEKKLVEAISKSLNDISQKLVDMEIMDYIVADKKLVVITE